MPQLTPNYALAALQVGERFSENGGQFTNRDRFNIDHKLYIGAEAHHHTGAAIAHVDPESALGLTLVPGGGTIPAGTTVRYRHTWVDVTGAETGASPEATITTPPPIATPGRAALSKTDTGGVLVQGSYFYKLSAWVTETYQETAARNQSNITLSAGVTAGAITLTLPDLPAGADGFNVYRKAPGETRFHFLEAVDMQGATPPTTYVDSGTVDPNCTRVAATDNNTNSGYAVDIDIQGATPFVPEGLTWRLYRTYEASDWTNSRLAWVVEQTFEGSGIVVTDYTDVGTTTTDDTYPTISELITSPSKILLTDGAEVEGTLPPGLTTGSDVVLFSMPGPIEPDLGNFVWVCPYDDFEIRGVYLSAGRFTTPSDTITVDVNLYDVSLFSPTFTTIYTTQANRPQLLAGEWSGEETVPDITRIHRGDGLTFDVDDSDDNTATPTGEDLVVYVAGFYRNGSTTVSYDWGD